MGFIFQVDEVKSSSFNGFFISLTANFEGHSPDLTCLLGHVPHEKRKVCTPSWPRRLHIRRTCKRHERNKTTFKKNSTENILFLLLFKKKALYICRAMLFERQIN